MRNRNSGKLFAGHVVRALLSAAALTCVTGATGSAQEVSHELVELGPKHEAGKPNIVVVDAGGTLESRARDRISYLHYSGHVDGGVRTIVGDLYPELAAVANVSIVHIGGLGGSGAVNGAALFNVSRQIDAMLAKKDVDGVVVTVGTSVLEEDAYFFDLTVRSQKPVVVTGSMHQYGTLTYDAYTNLFSAIRLAASARTTCFGTVVLLNDQVFAARDVTKSDGYRMDTFKDRLTGPLGVVNESNVNLLRAPSRVMQCGKPEWQTPFDLGQTTPARLAQVDIAYGYYEASGATISGLVAGGAKGIVTAGFGPGDISMAQSAARKQAIGQGTLFVSTTRTGGEGTYDDGISPGIIGGGNLPAQKARILLQLALSFSSDPERIRQWFNTIGAARFDMSKAVGTVK